jgi:hypothetical protein
MNVASTFREHLRTPRSGVDERVEGDQLGTFDSAT